MSVIQMLGSLSLAVQSKGGADGIGRLSAWSCGDHLSLAEGRTDRLVDWDGQVTSVQMGADVLLRRNLLVGLAIVRSSGSFDYRVGSGATKVGGDHELRLNGIHPYVVWSPSSRLTLWGTVGHAWGELSIEDDLGGGLRSRGTTLGSGALGVHARLFSRGATTATVKGEAGIAQFGVTDPGVEFGPAALDLSRLKFAAEAAREYKFPDGDTFAHWGELGVRHDGGEGETGTGLELGGGMRYRNAAMGWTVETHGRRLMTRGDMLPREWGLGAAFRVDPGPIGLGPSVSLGQSWGQTGSGIDRLWEQDTPEHASDARLGRRTELRLGYGFSVFGGRGVLTPFGTVSLDHKFGRSYRWGVGIAAEPSASVTLEAERREPDSGPRSHGVVLRGVLRF